MKAASIGATLILLAREWAAEEAFLATINQLSPNKTDVGVELTRNSLLHLFNDRNVGHDGAAMIVVHDVAVPWIQCTRIHFPLMDIPGVHKKGLRHHSAASASTLTKSLLVVVSQETRQISAFHRGKRYLNLEDEAVRDKVRRFMCDLPLGGS